MAIFFASVYTERRKKLAELMGSGLILLQGNEESGMNYAANTYHFRQDSTFLYFFGIDRPGLSALIDLDSGKTTVFGHEVTMDDIVWEGNLPSLSEEASACGVENTASPEALNDALTSAMAAGRQIHFLPPYRAENRAKIHHWLGFSLKEVNQQASAKLMRAIVSLREIKGEEEVAELQKAVRLTNKLHLAAMRNARPGMTEAEVVGHVMKEVAAADSVLSFPIIFSRDGQILHNHSHKNVLQEGDLILMDCGAEAPYSHYAGDMTRAWPADPNYTLRQKEIYEVVLDAEMSVLRAAKPGVVYKDMHLLAAERIVRGLQQLGLMKGDVEEAVSEGAHALFFPHGLGHAMGLDVHDMEDFGENYVGYSESVKRSSQFGLSFLRFGKELKEGMVMTVEPGIYFIPELIDQWKSEQKFSRFLNYEKIETYKDFGGIRIEDDIIVTAEGNKVLGDGVPKTVKEVESVRQR